MQASVYMHFVTQKGFFFQEFNIKFNGNYSLTGFFPDQNIFFQSLELEFLFEQKPWKNKSSYTQNYFQHVKI